MSPNSDPEVHGEQNKERKTRIDLKCSIEIKLHIQ